MNMKIKNRRKGKEKREKEEKKEKEEKYEFSDSLFIYLFVLSIILGVW